MKPSDSKPFEAGEHLRYSDAGVDTAEAARELTGLLGSLRRTLALRAAGQGRVLLDFGHYANVLDLGQGIGLAISTDGVGSKILVAEMAGRYDTLGIDLIAMNVNDLLCVGAEPLAMVDYIAMRRLEDEILEQIGRGLLAGAQAARITIPGGELAQLPDMIAGARPDQGLDLVGTAVGVVAPDRILTGSAIAAGDVAVGFASTGLHSNGYALVRRVLFDKARLPLDRHLPEIGRTLAEELLEPTRIYVGLAMDLLKGPHGAGVHGMAHITGDGIRNLLRLHPRMSYTIDRLPEPPPIFSLIAARGPIDVAEMLSVFNMGIGFVAVVQPQAVAEAQSAAARHGIASWVLGEARDDGRREIHLADRRLRLGLDGVIT
jgi:phosphoribosylformylglycinamidine cyclo-ligase